MGPDGAAGSPGAEGPPGPQGPVGEVSQAALDAAIAGTAVNPAALSPLSLTISDPPTQAEVVAVLDKLNELIGAVKR